MKHDDPQELNEVINMYSRSDILYKHRLSIFPIVFASLVPSTAATLTPRSMNVSAQLTPTALVTVLFASNTSPLPISLTASGPVNKQ